MATSCPDDVAVEQDNLAIQRARSGAKWLDAKFGPDWDTRIDVERLDIASPSRCIIGQLIRHGYLSLLFAAGTGVVDHGFSLGLLDLVVVLLPLGPIRRAYRPLNDAWKAVLHERRDNKVKHAIWEFKIPLPSGEHESASRALIRAAQFRKWRG